MRTALVLLLSSLVGCTGSGGGPDGGTGGGAGGSGGGAGGGAGSSVPLTDYCARFAEAGCAFSIRCGTAAAGADCNKLTQPQRWSLINARKDCLSTVVRAGLDAGRTLYDGARAASCFAQVADTAACSPIWPYLPADCAAAFQGTVGLNGPCFGSADCAPALYCDATAPVCPGACRPRVALGGFATTALACPVGAQFSLQSDGGGSCRALVAPGGDCAPPPGAYFPLACEGASVCLLAADGGRACQAPLPAGSPCSVASTTDCAMGTTCTPRPDAGSLCVALAKRGEACSSGGSGVSCLAGLGCVGNVCTDTLGLGAACAIDADCGAGLVCSTGAVCRPFGGPDAGCNTANFQDDCQVGLYCERATARCTQRLGADAVCTGYECDVERGLLCSTPTDGGASRCRPGVCLAP